MRATRFSFTCLCLFSVLSLFAQKPAVFSPGGKALNGYDPVAYFTEGRPVRGESAYAVQWQGATWHFANAQHRDAFRADPERYAPQYGGYCAYGMSRGYKAPTEADAWTILDGKLYLNYNQKVRTEWDKDRGGYIRKADENWPQVKSR